MGKGSYPTDDEFGKYMTKNCNPAFGAYIGKAYEIRTSTSTGRSRPTSPGNRATGPCCAPPNIRGSIP